MTSYGFLLVSFLENVHAHVNILKFKDLFLTHNWEIKLQRKRLILSNGRRQAQST
jgi:hypothetical protein